VSLWSCLHSFLGSPAPRRLRQVSGTRFRPALEELEKRELLTGMRGVYALGPLDGVISQAVLSNPYTDGVIIRATWNSIETADGVYDWSNLTSQVDAAVAAGKHVSLRIVPGINTPSWVYNAGAQAFSFTSGGQTKKIPVPWDSVYLTKWEGFIQAFGQQFSGHAGLVEVSLTGVNTTSEETWLPNTHAEALRWQSIGYTRLEVENAWTSIAATWAQAFPQQQLGLSMVPGGFPTIDDFGNLFSNPQGVDLQLTNDLIQTGISAYGSQFVVQNDGLSDYWISQQVMAVANQVTTGYEMLWMVTGDSSYRMNGGTPIGPANALQEATTAGLNGGAKYLIYYPADVENSALQNILSNTQMALTGVTPVGPVGTITSATPTFSWTAADQADHYDIWVDNVTTGQGQVLRNQHATGTSWTPSTPLVEGDAYRWWIRGVSSSGATSPWSQATNFSVVPLATPVVSGPSGSASDATPTFAWSAVDQADHYDLWVADLTTGQNQVLRNTDVVGTPWTPSTPLAQGNSYEWWVRAVSSTGATSPWTTGQDFSVVPLATPVPAGPTGSTTQTTPTFSWSAVPLADHYDLWVNNVTTGQSQVLRNQNVSGTSWTPSTPLVQGDSYVWWVEAIASSDLGTTSSWSAAQQFSIPPLASPAVTGPAGTTTSLLPTFTWAAVDQADHYDVWVTDLTTGQAQVLRDPNVSGTAWTPSTPLVQGHTYNWWVRAVSSSGGLSAWSSTQSLTVIPLATPILIGPIGPTPGSTPTFSWNPVAQADHYIIWINDLTTGQRQVFFDQNVTSTSWAPPTNLTQGDTYIWWVQAVSADGNTSLWSSGMTFTST
jgi:small neutral amino acid transporter SnatA (MarC family)